MIEFIATPVQDSLDIARGQHWQPRVEIIGSITSRSERQHAQMVFGRYLGEILTDNVEEFSGSDVVRGLATHLLTEIPPAVDPEFAQFALAGVDQVQDQSELDRQFAEQAGQAMPGLTTDLNGGAK